jgi:hypothetical protein
MYSALRPLSEDYLENAQRVRYFCYNHDINFSKVLLWPAVVWVVQYPRVRACFMLQTIRNISLKVRGASPT